jgi:hypothetical protein
LRSGLGADSIDKTDAIQIRKCINYAPVNDQYIGEWGTIKMVKDKIYTNVTY